MSAPVAPAGQNNSILETCVMKSGEVVECFRCGPSGLDLAKSLERFFRMIRICGFAEFTIPNRRTRRPNDFNA
jgi:hypothetical protein